MKNLKRALCLFLALVMCLSMLPMNVFAASIAEGAEAGVTEGTGNEPAPEGGEADEPEGATTPGDSENSEETGDSQDSEEVKNESEGNEGTEDPADNTVENEEPEDPTKPVVVDPAKLVEENDGTEEEALEVANLFTLVAGAYLTDEEDLNEVKFPAKLYFKADDVDEQFDFIEASFPEEDTEPEVVALTEDAITWQGTEVEVTFIPDEAATYEELLEHMEIDDGRVYARQRISYNANGGYGYMGPVSSDQFGNVTVSSNDFTAPTTWDGKSAVFAGWNTNPDGTGTPYEPDESITLSDSITLYAQWNRPVKFYVLIGGVQPGEGVSDAVNNYYPKADDNGGVPGADTSTGFTTGYLTQYGWSQLGWTKTTGNPKFEVRNGFATSGDEAYLVTDQLNLGRYSADNGYTIRWYVLKNQADGIHCDGYATNLKMNVTYHSNFDTNQTYEQEALTGQATDVMTYAGTKLPERAGWSFDYWTTNSNGTGDKYYEGATNVFAGNTHLYAHWTQIPTYSVIFVPNGGNLDGNTDNVVTTGKHASDPMPEAPNFVKDGYTFTGWLSSVDGQVYGTAAKPLPQTVTQTVTYTAQWEQSTATVTYHANNGVTPEQTENDTAPVGEYAVKANDGEDGIGFTKADYDFAGWMLTENGSDVVTMLTIEAGQKYHLYAKWVETKPVISTDPTDPTRKDITKTAQVYGSNGKLTEATSVEVGQLVTYTVTVNPDPNGGLVKTVTITDPMLDVASITAVKVGTSTLGSNGYTAETENGVTTITLTTATRAAISVTYTHEITADDVDVDVNDPENPVVSNTAAVTVANGGGQDGGEATKDLPVVEPNVSVKKFISKVGDRAFTETRQPGAGFKAYVGETIEWTIEVTNNGEAVATGVAVAENFAVTTEDDSARTLTSLTLNGKNVELVDGKIPVGTVYPGQTKTYKAAYTVQSGDTTISNGASIEGEQPEPPEPPVIEVDTKDAVSVAKSVAINGVAVTGGALAKAKVGDVLTYTIRVTNNGNVAYTTKNPLVITDTLTGGNEARVPDSYGQSTAYDVTEATQENPVSTFTIKSLRENDGTLPHFIEITYTYTVQAKDAGKTLNNTAIASNVPGTPGDEQSVVVDKLISSVTKTLVTDGDYYTEAAGQNVTLTDDGKLVVTPNAESITLVYRFTVEGDAGASFTINDKGAALVEGSVSEGGTVSATGDGVFTGTIPEGATSVTFDVTMTFRPNDKGEYTLVNKATVENAPANIEDPEAKSFTVKVQYVADDETDLNKPDYVVIVPKNEPYDVSKEIPEAIEGTTYVLDTVDKETKGTATGNVTITATYAVDEIGTDPENPNKPDGTPDKYQATVTYKVVNGYWSKTGETEDKADKTVVVTLATKDANGEWTPVAEPELEIPDVSKATPNTGYKAEGAKWDKDPANVELKGDREYTFTYTFPEDPKAEHSLTVRVEYYKATLNSDGTLTSTDEPTAKDESKSTAHITDPVKAEVKIAPKLDQFVGYRYYGFVDCSVENPVMNTESELNPTYTKSLAKNAENAVYVLKVYYVPALQVTEVTKELVTNEAAGLNTPEDVTISYPNENGVIVPNGNSVTLLYAITITGEAGANYILTDASATLLDANGNEVTEIKGTIPAGGEVTYYAYKTFDASESGSFGALSNKATVDAGGNTVVNPADPEATVYTVTYRYSGMVPENAPKLPQTVIVAEGKEVTALDVAAPAGYTFNGWTNAGLPIGNDGTFTMPAHNVILTGTFTAGSVTITYQTEDSTKGTVSRTADTLNPATGTPAGSTATASEGYVFKNWTKDVLNADGTVASSTEVSRDAHYAPAKNASNEYETATYTAHFAEDRNNNGQPDDEELRYTVTYTDGVENAEVFPDQKTEGLLPGVATPAFNGTPTREGYTFTGWDPAVAETVTDTVVYKATWAKNLTVTYVDGVDDQDVFEDQVYNELFAGDRTPAFVGTPTRTGYTFKGWTPAVAETVTGTVVYKATWAENRTVTYMDGVGAENGTQLAQFGNLLDGDNTPVIVAPTRSGYTFAGWTVANDDTSVPNKAVPEKVSGNATYVANWTANEAKIVFVTNGGNTVDPMTGVTDEKITKAMPVPTREGYTFNGWFDIADNEIKTLPEKFPAGTTVYYARWTEKGKVSISYEAVRVDSMVAGTVSKTSESLNPTTGVANGSTAVAEKGYKFVGWFATAEAEEGEKALSTKVTYVPTKSAEDSWTETTYFARFEVDNSQTKTLTYTVEYYKDNVKVEGDTQTETKTVQWLVTDTSMAVDEAKIDTANKYYGCMLEKIEVNDVEAANKELPTTVNNGDVIKVYFVRDPNLLKTLTYTVEYYKDNVKVEGDTVTKTETVQVLSGGFITVDQGLYTNGNKYPGYTLHHTDPTQVGEKVVSGTVIKVYYTEKTDADDLVTITYVSEDTAMGTVDNAKDENLKPATGNAAGSTATPNAGYKFLNWTDAQNNVVSYAPKFVPEKVGGVNVPATYTAHFEVDGGANKELSYTVQYYKDGNLVSGDTQTVKETVTVANGTDSLTVDASKINTTDKYYGYTFENTEPATIPDTVDSGTIIKVYYKADEAKIVFVTNGGSSVEDMVGVTDGTIESTTMPTPTRSGYTLEGWYSDQGLTQKVEALPAKFPAGTTVYYAKWTDEEDVTITYQVADSDEDMGDVDTASESLAPASGNAAGSTATANAGYKFLNWTDAEGNVVSKNATFVPAKVDGLNVAAAYTAHFFPDRNGNNVDDRDEPRTVTYTDGVENDTVFQDQTTGNLLDGDATPKFMVNGKEADPTRDGYVFVCWSPDVAKTVNGNATYTAIWSEQASVTISYEATTGGTVSSASESLNPVLDETAQGSTAIAEPGYKFVNWTDAEGKEVGTSAKFAPTKPTSGWTGTTYYAKFAEDVYHITYELNGGTLPENVTNPDTYKVTNGDITLNNPTRDGYTFAGWSGTGLTGNGNKTVTIATGSTGDRHYVAHWTEDNHVTISYVSANETMGTVSSASESLNPATGVAKGSTATANEGYKFVGWFATETAMEGETALSTDPTYKPTKDANVSWEDGTTYYARFVVDDSQTKDLHYTVVYYKNGLIDEKSMETVKKDVQVLQPDTMAVTSKINTTNKFEGFALDKVVVGGTEVAANEIPDTVSNGTVIKVYYATDEVGNTDDPTTPNNVPDKYELKVTFQIENGLWGTGTADDKVIYLPKLVETDKYDENGKATLKAAEFPSTTPALPFDGFTQNGAWTEDGASVVAEDKELTEDTVYVFTYTAKDQMTVEAKGYEGVYDGKWHDPISSLIVKDPEGNVIYDLKGTQTGGVTIAYDKVENQDEIKDVQERTIVLTIGHEAYNEQKVTVVAKITPKTLTITTPSASKTNNGTPLTATDGKIEGLVDGEKVELKVTGKQSELGQSKNTYELEWANGVLQSNYVIEEKLGTLIVIPSDGSTIIVRPDPNPNPGGGGVDIEDEDPPLANVDGNLNTTDHFAYIIGRGENCVQPLENITRAEVATIFFRLLTEDFRVANWSTVSSFPDVEAGAWYATEIATAERAGILKGCDDGNMQPDRDITRAEFTVMAIRFLNGSIADDGTGDFADTANHWAAKEIRLAAKAGWIKGYGNNFRPNDPITRAEAMTIINRMLDRVPGDTFPAGTIEWGDNPKGAWYYADVMEATNGHDYEREEGSVVEKWTAITPYRDWIALEAEWTANNGASAPASEEK